MINVKKIVLSAVCIMVLAIGLLRKIFNLYRIIRK